MSISCRRMEEASREDALRLLEAFLREDEHYLDSSAAYGAGGGAAVAEALQLFLHRPEAGFVWLAYEGTTAVGVCVVCYAISTSLGAVVAKLDDVYVDRGQQRRGIGSAMLRELKTELRAGGVRRIDTAAHLGNAQARGFYQRHGFSSLQEERLACVL